VDLETKLIDLVLALQESVNAEYRKDYPNVIPPAVTLKRRVKFICVDIGTSGAFMVEKATGELYNIKAYGVPDRNKKAKADIGNIFTADLSKLYALRYNYLR
jgi:hypothetical protein